MLLELLGCPWLSTTATSCSPVVILESPHQQEPPCRAEATFWGWVFLLSSSAEHPDGMGEQFWHIFANQRLAKVGGGTPGASLLSKRNPRRLVANSMGVTTSFLDYLSPWEETRGALNACVLVCKSILRTGQKKIRKAFQREQFCSPFLWEPAQTGVPKGETSKDARRDLLDEGKITEKPLSHLTHWKHHWILHASRRLLRALHRAHRGPHGQRLPPTHWCSTHPWVALP